MTKNAIIKLAIQAVNKVKPSIRDSQMGGQQREEYEKWMEVIHWLESQKDKEK
jgi:hypothetical protein